MNKTVVTTEKIESFLRGECEFQHWSQNSLEDIVALKNEGDLQFIPNKPIEGVTIKENLHFATEYLRTLSESLNPEVSDFINSSTPFLEKAKSLLENYFEYQSLIDSLLPRLPAKIPSISFNDKILNGFEVIVSSEKHSQGFLLYDLTSRSVIRHGDIWMYFYDIKRCYFLGLAAFPEFPPFSLHRHRFKYRYYPRSCYVASRERALLKYALNENNGLSSYTVEVQCLSRFEGLDWSASFSRIIFGLIFSEGDIGRVCDLIADQITAPRNLKFLEDQISSWRDALKTKHLPFKLIRTLCALAKRGRSSHLASIVYRISSHLSVPLGILEKSMLLYAGNQDLFNELKGAVLHYILQPQNDIFTTEDQAICFAIEALAYSNRSLGRQVLIDVRAHLRAKNTHEALLEVASGLIS